MFVCLFVSHFPSFRIYTTFIFHLPSCLLHAKTKYFILILLFSSSNVNFGSHLFGAEPHFWFFRWNMFFFFFSFRSSDVTHTIFPQLRQRTIAIRNFTCVPFCVFHIFFLHYHHFWLFIRHKWGFQFSEVEFLVYAISFCIFIPHEYVYIWSTECLESVGTVNIVECPFGSVRAFQLKIN